MKSSNPLRFNKYLAAILCAALFIMLADMVVGALTHEEALISDVYAPVEIEVAATESEAVEAVEEVVVFDANAFFASANADAGSKVIKKCAACHNFDQGSAHKVGPNLFGMINAPIASKDGFNYSQSILDYKVKMAVWSPEMLVHFLRKPKAAVPGTAMGFAGLKDKDIANLLAFLNQTYSEAAIDLTAAQ